MRAANHGVVAESASIRRFIGAVVFDGAGADAQFGGDLFAGLVFGQQAQDAAFGGRQAVKPRWLWRRGSGAAATLYAINHYPHAEVYIA